MCQPRPSPLQNRVLPTGEVVADKARGMFTGNRGILPFHNGKLGVSRWTHQHWIICDLTHPKGTYHGPMPERAWTPLFFMDEAVALAAGHRPCAYCRPEAYARFKSAWQSRFGKMGHKDIDRALHHARVQRNRTQLRHTANASDLPDGCFVLHDNNPALIWEGHVYHFTSKGYSAAHPIPQTKMTVLTPRPTLDVLHQGYTPMLHNSANAWKQ